ncbi:hypothetical protein [Methylosinus sp. H3A]|uniref:hypothetical protein n=1 Tax=Methylosinus sp. H3A TaxID=2785786 RepID=UPI001AEE745A|nr:hypothetical protein [Methylosinus sp. H3A]
MDGRPERAADPIAPPTPVAAVAEASTEPADAEPTKEDCVSAVDKVRALASALPADHPSRYIAERHLHQSMVEAGNGEFDDCLYWAARASDEVTELRHALRPGEAIEVLRPDETPEKAETPGKSAEKKPARERARR